MYMYWVYNIPNWLFELLTIGLFVVFGLAGGASHSTMDSSHSRPALP